MSVTNDTSFYYDLNSLDSMRAQARKDQGEALKTVAKQFEAIFMRTMLKSMRQASVDEESLMSSDNEKFYRDMYDDQLVQELTKNNSIGLADVLEKQIRASIPTLAHKETSQVPQKSFTVDPRQRIPALPVYKQSPATAISQPIAEKNTVTDNHTDTANAVVAGQHESEESKIVNEITSPRQFVEQAWNYAKKAANELGVSTKTLIAQAALETGWGQKVLKNTDGSSTHNYFNIKASRGWSGERVNRNVEEVIDGVRVVDQSDFRAYQDMKDSFQDYVQFIKNNRRYSALLEKNVSDDAYVDNLQKAGYATDPMYAAKIKQIMRSELITSASEKLDGMNGMFEADGSGG